MKTIRSNKYRRRRRRSDRTKFLMIAAGIGGAVLIAAAVVAVGLILLFHSQKKAPAETADVSSAETAAVSSEIIEGPSSEIVAINPNAATAKSTGRLSYQSLYPEMYVPIVKKIPAKDGDKVVYLTFDSGPSNQTSDLLEALEEADVKATFFVTCQGSMTESARKRIKEIAKDGHAVGVYSYGSDREKLYASVEDYLADFSQMSDVIYEATGEKPTIFRFPGGSRCEENEEIYEELVAEMERRGFSYFDWNVDSGDSLTAASEKMIYDETVEGITTHGKSIVLMHNTASNQNTVKQIVAIINKAKKEGYRFDVLDPSVKPFSFASPE